MAEKINTSTLMKRLFKTKHLDAFLEQNEHNMQAAEFDQMIRSLCEERGLVPEQVILRAEIDRTYGYQIFRGIRKPSRDKILQIALGMHLNMEETAKLLRLAGLSPLYPRLKREAVILYCLRKGASVLDTQELLSRYGFSLLGSLRN